MLYVKSTISNELRKPRTDSLMNNPNVNLTKERDEARGERERDEANSEEKQAIVNFRIEANETSIASTSVNPTNVKGIILAESSYHRPFGNLLLA